MHKALATAAAAIVFGMAVAGGEAKAAPIDFTFSFTDGVYTVNGLIKGLDPALSTPQEATEVIVSPGSGLGLDRQGGTGVNYVDPQFPAPTAINRFVFSSGALAELSFTGFNVGLSAAYSFEFLSLQSFPILLCLAGPCDSPPSQILGGRVTISPVPLPAALPFFTAGVAALAYAGRRKRKVKVTA
jgi:hypothetical protein